MTFCKPTLRASLRKSQFRICEHEADLDFYAYVWRDDCVDEDEVGLRGKEPARG